MSQPRDSAAGRARRITRDLRHSLLVLGYAAMIYWLAGRPELGTDDRDPLTRVIANLYHMPLYAGLGFFILQAISRGQALAAHRLARAALTLVLTALFAGFDELHQAFVPRRTPSLGDFLLDLAGVAGLLLICALGTAHAPPRIQEDAVAPGVGAVEGRRGP